MLSKNIGLWLVAAVIFLLLGVLLFAGDRSLLLQWRNPPEKVVFHTGKGQINFEIEVADTDKKRRKGLMYREKLAENSGMLFVFPKSDIRSFWMKNTRWIWCLYPKTCRWCISRIARRLAGKCPVQVTAQSIRYAM